MLLLVIAREAKQSIVPQTLNMDCFVALLVAMTRGAVKEAISKSHERT
jgi:hypothetical protein